MDELVNAQHAPNHGPIADHHVAGHGHPVGDHDPITEVAVVAQVAVGHQQVATADAGLLAIGRGPIDRHAFADAVVVANHHLGGGAVVLEVLGFEANAGPGENAVAAAHMHPAINHHMGTNAGASTDCHLRANDRIGADVDPSAQFGLGIDHGGGMDPRLDRGTVHG